MKRVLFTFLFTSLVMGSYAQQYSSNNQYQQTDTVKKEKISYLTVSGMIGSSSIDYKLNSLQEKGTNNGGLGYGFDLRYSYFFNFHWGVTAGVGMSQYTGKGKLKGSMELDPHYKVGNFTDDDWQDAPKDFELRTRVTNLEEKQTAWLVEVPLMASYQTYFGDSARWGIYGGLGAKLQFPVSAKYRIQNGANSQFNVSGQYDGIPTDMGAPGNPPVPQHGYGTITDPNSTLDWDDKAKLKMGVALTAEFGFLIDLGKDMDLMVGGYMDYGLNDLKKNGDRKLFTASSAYHPGADKKVGTGIDYNGMLNSDVTGKIKLISFGGKLALRFKL